MQSDLSPGEKAARKRKRRAAAAKAVTTRKRLNAFDKVRANEAASKEALRSYCEAHKWRVAFFEGKSGAPRTGIIDAIIFRISKQNADVLDLRLVQLKGGNAGVSEVGGETVAAGLLSERPCQKRLPNPGRAHQENVLMPPHPVRILEQGPDHLLVQAPRGAEINVLSANSCRYGG